MVWRSKSYLYVITVILLFSVRAFTMGLSPSRAASDDYKIHTKQLLKKLRQLRTTEKNKSPFELAVPANEAKFENVTTWNDENTLISGFRRLRDERFLDDPDVQNFKRRSSWLLPDDGCYARAEIANDNLAQWNFAKPKKIFVFGNLAVKTKNSPHGEVFWWYHVAPLVQVGENFYVLDPAIHPTEATELYTWLKAMNPRTNEINVAVCSGDTYDPSSSCENPRDYSEQAISDQVGLLSYERSRQLELRRDPDKVLGENPPW